MFYISNHKEAMVSTFVNHCLKPQVKHHCDSTPKYHIPISILQKAHYNMTQLTTTPLSILLPIYTTDIKSFMLTTSLLINSPMATNYYPTQIICSCDYGSVKLKLFIRACFPQYIIQCALRRVLCNTVWIMTKSVTKNPQSIEESTRGAERKHKQVNWEKGNNQSSITKR